MRVPAITPLSQVITIRPVLGSDLSKSLISISHLFIVYRKDISPKHCTNKQLLFLCYASNKNASDGQPYKQLVSLEIHLGSFVIMAHAAIIASRVYLL